MNPSDSSYKTQVFTTGVIKPDDPFRKNAAFHEAPSQGGGLVSYEDTNGDGFFTSGVDPIYNMGPVEITGADFTKATAQYVPAGTSVITSAVEGLMTSIVVIRCEGSHSRGSAAGRGRRGGSSRRG